jgi:transcriptional regulator with XRE-family HTH domain
MNHPAPWVDIFINPWDYSGVTFGQILRELRSKSGLGIKRLAPELGVSYSYLSKLENNEVGPSEEMVTRVARYFKYDRTRLLLTAGKVPQDVLDILRDNPDEAVEFLRARFGRRK